MNYVDRLNGKISKYNPDNYDDLISFRRRMWPTRSLYLEEIYWKWQFQKNPNNLAQNPQIWIFKDNGQILGHQAAIPVLLKVLDVYYHCSWAVDLIVDPSFRNKGIGILLTKELSKSTDISLALGISNAAYSMYKRDKWIDMGYVPRFVKIFNSECLVRKRLRLPGIPKVISIAINLYFRLRDFRIIKTANKYNVQIDKIEHFNESFDNFFEIISNSFPLIIRRDSKYLNWKFVTQPGMKYTIFQMNQNGNIFGYIVLRIGHEDNRRVGYIVDFLALPEQFTPLMLKAIYYFRKERVSTIICDVLNEKIESLMKKLGFYRRGSSTHFMVKINNPNLKPELFMNRDNWFINSGDSDRDRPWED